MGSYVKELLCDSFFFIAMNLLADILYLLCTPSPNEAPKKPYFAATTYEHVADHILRLDFADVQIPGGLRKECCS